MTSPEQTKFEGHIMHHISTRITEYKPGYLIFDKDGVNIWTESAQSPVPVWKCIAKYECINPRFYKSKGSVASFEFIQGRNFPSVVDDEIRKVVETVYFKAAIPIVGAFCVILSDHLGILTIHAQGGSDFPNDKNRENQIQEEVNVTRPVNNSHFDIQSYFNYLYNSGNRDSINNDPHTSITGPKDIKNVSRTVKRHASSDSCDNQAKVHKAIQCDFSLPDEFSNVTLVVDGKKLQFSRGFLSTMSKKFKSMLTKDFGENKNVIALIGPPGMELKYEQFMELMKVIHPPHADVNGTFYEIELVFKLADIFLAVRDKNHRLVPLIKKVLDVETYADKLHETKSLVYEEFKNVSVARELAKMPEFGALTSVMKAKLIQITYDTCHTTE